ncbi:transposase [Horticoccus luteus]|uniref:Transposase n=1 Tax=Horticoccus luteus TaxID=2862869 RepID=A0A8F9TTC1_9BACT|nr:transposase [Horticoccus luteus]QYM77750.1 transposase [Horticoccus luteus]
MESEAGVYHVINRGNYRADIFRSEKTRAAFLTCLDEACAKTGWQVHAWCLMSNHYHLAVSTPAANLVEGMRWLQGTFAVRFNRLREERGHLFQGRYKSLIVDPDAGLGPLCHYIHLNPVRAGLRNVADLTEYPWASLHWLMNSKKRPDWYDPQPALTHAGSLADTAAGRKKYLGYLNWLAEDEPAQKEQRFAEMSKGWIVGTTSFAKAVLQEHRALVGQGRRMAAEMKATREALWQEELAALLARLKRGPADVEQERKSAVWKTALAAAMKDRTTATNRWLGEALNMGGLHEVSRQVGRWKRNPDVRLSKQLA